MKRMTKLTAVSMAAVIAAASLTACGSSTSPATTEKAAETTAASGETAAPAGDSGDKQFKVGICQLVQHSALDAATKGFVDVLKEKYGDNVVIDEQNAQGDSATCTTIINGFVSNEYDLILANATPALQAAMNATQDIPILGTSVTDYGTALAMDNFDATKGTGINVSGTSDLAPLGQQEDMILEIVPDVKKVSILYCSAEANSKFQATEIGKYLKEDGIDYQEFTFADSNDLQSVVQSAVADCDALYIPTDNTAASNMTVVTNIVQPAGIPIICGEENMMMSGGLATLSISYEDLGRATGEQAIEILSNGADVKTMPIAYASATTKEYNKAYADAIGITMPSDYKALDK
ncbi:ABC-type transport system, periplasmic component [Lachnospiraceae bacterium JC7]|nr:ABC-type transport system, periplasmic component [Lachnospiraceae bacterium JC7]